MTCINFQGFIASNGYGRCWSKLNKKMTSAHRAAYEDAHGAIPDGMVVMHTCDNRRCVNINHLRLGTQSDNLRDMHTKGRRSHRHEDNPHAKLTPEQVALIRESPLGCRALGRLLDVHHSTISSIRRGASWAA